MKTQSSQNFWRDPVWSKVIATAIVAVAGLILTGVASLFGKESFGDVLKMFMMFQVPLFAVIIFLLLAVFVTISIMDSKNGRKPSFLNVTEMTIGQFTWTWSWERDESTGRYYVGELHLLCPTCKGAMHCGWMEHYYKCINQHFVSTSQVDYSVAYNQIQHNIINRFPSEKGQLELK